MPTLQMIMIVVPVVALLLALAVRRRMVARIRDWHTGRDESGQTRAWRRAWHRRHAAGVDEVRQAEGHPDVRPAGPQTPSGVVEDLAQLVRVQWAVRAVLALGILATVSGNVLHANGDLVSRIISAWPPAALLITIELIARVPVHRPAITAVRRAVTAVIAGIAAWVSYWHMVAVASQHGETPSASHLIPVSVDGLVIVASVCLVELAGRIRARAHRQVTAVPADPAVRIAELEDALAAALAGEAEAVARAAISAQELAATRAEMAETVDARVAEHATAAAAAASAELADIRTRWGRLRDGIVGIIGDDDIDPIVRRALAAAGGLPMDGLPDPDAWCVVADVPTSKTDLTSAALVLTGGRPADAAALLERVIPDATQRPHRSYVSRIASRMPSATVAA